MSSQRYSNASMGASGRSPLWRENSVSSQSTATRTKRKKSTLVHALTDDDQKVEEVERRVNGLNEQLTVMQRMINGALKSQKQFQEELQVANDTCESESSTAFGHAS